MEKSENKKSEDKAEKVKKWKAQIRAYAIKNAIEHEGKAQEASVLAGLFHEGLKKEEVGKIINEVKEEVEKINKLSLREQEQEYSIASKFIGKRKERKGLPELPNAKKGKVIMRFSPSPSGPLHIGHALTGMPSALYVQKYKGKFILRIEDTNPENIYPKAYKMLKEEAKWLFGHFCKISKVNIQSERLKIYYKYAENLIKKGKAYVCDCSQKRIQENRVKGVECSCRQFPISEHLKRWKKMLDKIKEGYKEGEAILRFKGNMQEKNPAFRDFPLARINETKHPLQGSKYRVWPLMNFAVAVDDIEEKITHSIRAKDHKDNAERQRLIFQALGKEKSFPWTGFLGRWHFLDLELSTTKMRKAIEKRKYKGWDDIRLPTITSLRKQGYKPEAFAKLAEQRGISEVDKKISRKEFFQLLEQFNR